MKLLKFGKGNKKLSKNIYTFALPSGWTCPYADKCLSRVSVDKNGKASLQDGPNNEFRCFSASQEAVYPNVRKARWHNFDLLRGKSSDEMKVLINKSLPKNASMIRIHVAGDFFNQDYFDAWRAVAELNPNTTFYAYTKSLGYWLKRKKDIPNNLRLTASEGGKLDHMIIGNFKSAKVVYSENEAERLDLEIDHDDSHAYDGDESFALLLHGVQPKGTKAAEAMKKIRKAKKDAKNKIQKAA